MSAYDETAPAAVDVSTVEPERGPEPAKLPTGGALPKRFVKIPTALLGKIMDYERRTNDDGEVVTFGHASANAIHALAIKLDMPGNVLNEHNVRKRFEVGWRRFNEGLTVLKERGVLERGQTGRRSYATERIIGQVDGVPFVALDKALLVGKRSTLLAFVAVVNRSPDPVRPDDAAHRLGVTSKDTIRGLVQKARAGGHIAYHQDALSRKILVARRGYQFGDTISDRGVKELAKNGVTKNGVTKNGVHNEMGVSNEMKESSIPHSAAARLTAGVFGLELKDNNSLAKPTDEQFNRFFDAYPRHVDRQDALKVFMRLSPEDAESAIVAAGQFAAEFKRSRKELAYCKYPATWLRKRSFKDYESLVVTASAAVEKAAREAYYAELDASAVPLWPEGGRLKRDANKQAEGGARPRTDSASAEDAPHPTPEQFERFRAAYPRRDGVEAAREPFMALSREVAEQAISSAVKYAAKCKRDRIEERYIKGAQRWLNESAFKDYAPDPGRPRDYWWRDRPELLAVLKPEAWRKAIAQFANGNWPVATLGPGPWDPGCLAPQDVIIELGLRAKYPFADGRQVGESDLKPNWWQGRERQLSGHEAEFWETLIAMYANGTWPVEYLCYGPCDERCAVPPKVIAKLGLKEKYPTPDGKQVGH